jgi:hypothetical protein
VLDDKKLLLPLKSPFTKDLVKQTVVSKNWDPIYLNAFTAAWNTKHVSSADAPKSWEEVLTKYSGKLAMEVGDWDWFATLATQYFPKKGISEKKTVEMFKRAASGARMVDGHTLMTELLAAGEFNVAADVYKHRAAQLKKKGAPVEWEPPVQPIIIRPNGIGLRGDGQARDRAAVRRLHAHGRAEDADQVRPDAGQHGRARGRRALPVQAAGRRPQDAQRPARQVGEPVRGRRAPLGQGDREVADVRPRDGDRRR